MKSQSTRPQTTVFDDYACAALTGLLANPAVMAALGTQAWVNDTGATVPIKITNAAMEYAKIAMRIRAKIKDVEPE